METPPPPPPEPPLPPLGQPQPPLEPPLSGSSWQPIKLGIAEHDRTWCIVLHLSGLSGLLLGWALAHIIAPLVIWLIKRADSPTINATGKEVLNFQISYSIYFAVSAILWLFCIGVPVTIGLVIAWLILTIIAAVKTSNGEEYRYPYILRFLT